MIIKMATWPKKCAPSEQVQKCEDIRAWFEEKTRITTTLHILLDSTSSFKIIALQFGFKLLENFFFILRICDDLFRIQYVIWRQVQFFPKSDSNILEFLNLHTRSTLFSFKRSFLFSSKIFFYLLRRKCREKRAWWFFVLIECILIPLLCMCRNAV